MTSSWRHNDLYCIVSVRLDGISAAVLGPLFAFLGCCRGCWDSSIVHQLLKVGQSSKEVWLRFEFCGIPHFFGKGTCSYPYFGVMYVLVADFAPKTNHSPNYIVSIVIFKNIPNVILVQMQPSLVISVIASRKPTNSNIQIEDGLKRKYDVVIFNGCWHCVSPPLKGIAFLYFVFLLVGPVDELFLGC